MSNRRYLVSVTATVKLKGGSEIFTIQFSSVKMDPGKAKGEIDSISTKNSSEEKAFWGFIRKSAPTSRFAKNILITTEYVCKNTAELQQLITAFRNDVRGIYEITEPSPSQDFPTKGAVNE